MGQPPVHFVFMTRVLNLNEDIVESKPNLTTWASPLNAFFFFELSVKEYFLLSL